MGNVAGMGAARFAMGRGCLAANRKSVIIPHIPLIILSLYFYKDMGQSGIGVPHQTIWRESF